MTQAQTALTVRQPWVHDPVMAREDSLWHLYCTGRGIQHFTSSDLLTWTIDSVPVIRPVPQWARDSVPGLTSHLWAPDILYWHGRWWLTYSCSTFGRNTSAIGLMSSPSLTRSRWTDRGCVIASRGGRDNWNAIDPNIYIDSHDESWLVFGSFWDGIQLVPLDSTLHVPAAARPRTIARRVSPTVSHGDCPSTRAGDNAIEAPFIFHHGPYYYLFVSWDYCCRGMKSTYRVVYGRSQRVEGPYVDKAGRLMLEGGGELLFEGDKKQYEAAGHCAVYPMPGHADDAIFICHGYDVALDGASVLVTRALHFDADGWVTLPLGPLPALAAEGE